MYFIKYLSTLTTISSSDLWIFPITLLLYSIFRLIVSNFFIKKYLYLVDEKNKNKFLHRGFDSIHYILSTIIGTLAFLQRPYAHCPFYYLDCGKFSECTGDFLICSTFEKIYFIFFASYYMSDVFWIKTENEIIILIFHHFVTIGMIICCVIVARPVAGLSIMLLHDWGDIFLYSGKIANYLKLKKTANVLLILFALSFFYFRIFGCAAMIKVLFTEKLEQPHHFKLYLFGRILFCGLYCCHIFWGYEIVHSLIKILKGKETIRDTRSEDEKIQIKNKFE